MPFSICVLSGLALVGFGLARIKARLSRKGNVQTLFNLGK